MNGQTYHFAYTPGGRLESVQDPDGQTTYYAYNDPRGRLTQKTYPNGAWTTYTYQDIGPTGGPDARDLTSTVENGGASGSNFDETWGYAYDKVGNILQFTHNGSDTTNYNYDLAYRLKHEQSTLFCYDYRYDMFGNRTRKDKTVGQTVYTTNYYYADDNSLSSQDGADGVISYHYDSAGNLVSKTIGSQTTSYAYNVANNLTQAGASQFQYDLDGNRVHTSDSRGARTYLYANGGLYQELSTAGSILAWYNPGISQTSSGVKSFFLGNSQGSTTGLANSGGTPTLSYDAWGNRTDNSGAGLTPFAYVGNEGYYTDSDTGLIKLGARYYDPLIGRFITKDPKRDGLNWYAYAGDNPVNATDPSGLEDGTYDAWGGINDITASINKWFGGTKGDSCDQIIDTIGGGLDTGLAAIGSAFTFGYWDGGSWSNQPGFGVSKDLGYFGMGSGAAAVSAAAVPVLYGYGLATFQALTAGGGSIMLGNWFNNGINAEEGGIAAAVNQGVNWGYLNLPNWAYTPTANSIYINTGLWANKTFQFITNPNTANPGSVFEWETQMLQNNGYNITDYFPLK